MQSSSSLGKNSEDPLFSKFRNIYEGGFHPMIGSEKSHKYKNPMGKLFGKKGVSTGCLKFCPSKTFACKLSHILSYEKTYNYNSQNDGTFFCYLKKLVFPSS